MSNALATPKWKTRKPGDADEVNERPQAPMVVQPDFGSSTDKMACHEVAETMKNEMFVCDFEVLLENYGPVLVPPEDVKACKQNLQKLLRNFDGVEMWKAYTSTPVALEREEHEIFAHVKTIQNAISDWARAKMKNKNDYIFKLVPKAKVDAGTNCRMNACIIEHECSSKLLCTAVVFPMNLKIGKKLSDCKTVREEIAADCHHILSKDPRREFIFALTLENDRASLWYFSRTHSVKARSFDWTTDVDRFVAMFLSLAYATPEQLGLDPCVHKSPLDDGQYIYEFPRFAANTTGHGPETMPSPQSAKKAIQVTEPRPLERKRGAEKAVKNAIERENKIFYLTRECLKYSRPRCISGRMNRIWKAVEIKSIQDTTPVENASEVVIKDVWLHISQEGEGENQDRLFADVDVFVENGVKRAVDHYLDTNPSLPNDEAAREELESSEEMLQAFINSEPCCRGLDTQTKQRLQDLLTGLKYRSLFLTKLHHYKGNVTKPLAKDVTRQDVLLSSATKVKSIDRTYRTYGTTPNSSCQSDHPRNPKDSHHMQDIQENCKWEPKQRNRFVYEEVCLDLCQLPTLGDVMDVLAQAADALLLMYCAGWLHRDISIGNILALRTPNGYQVKLADLEFAQRMNDESKRKSDPQIGTPFFMALEIMQKEYLIDSEGVVEPFEVSETLSLASKFGLQPDNPHYSLLSRTPVHRAFSHLTELPSNTDFAHTPTGRIVKPNYQHDLESLWWIVLFIVTSLVDHPKSADYASTVFHHRLEPSSPRDRAFRGRIDGRLFKVLREDLRGVFAPLLEKLRRKMYDRAITMEVFGQQTNHEEYSEIHGFISTAFRDLAVNSDKSWRAIPIEGSTCVKNSKIATGLGNKHNRENDNEGPSSRPYKKIRLSSS